MTEIGLRFHHSLFHKLLTNSDCHLGSLLPSRAVLVIVHFPSFYEIGHHLKQLAANIVASSKGQKSRGRVFECLLNLWNWQHLRVCPWPGRGSVFLCQSLNDRYVAPNVEGESGVRPNRNDRCRLTSRSWKARLSSSEQTCLLFHFPPGLGLECRRRSHGDPVHMTVV